MRTSVASVCISGGLVEKLHACAEAGFDGVEIMDADLIAAPESPEEIRALCDRLGLKIEMFQPFRDAEGVSEELFADNLRRAEAKFQIMERLGTDLMLVCSNVATASVDDDEVIARQLGELADRAAVHGIRLAYEALAWGRYVDNYRRTWEIVKRADRPNLGVCLDSFHILSLAHDPAGIEQIDAEKIFFLQLADAPALDMDVLSWSRHHRLFPGEGSFDLVGFMTHVVRAGYSGPWSLEVFNDTYRQTDTVRTAAHAHRSLVWLADRTAAANGWSDGLLGEAPQSTGLDFVEVAGADLAEVDELLAQLGFAFEGRHRSKPVRLWSAGSARIILNEQARQSEPVLAGIGLRTADAAAAVSRALALGSPSVFRRTYEGEQDLRGVAAPDGTQVFWSSLPAERSWLQEFEGGTGVVDGLEGEIDHINLAYAWQDFDEAVLFMSSALSLQADAPAEVPGPQGLIRSQVMRTPDGIVRVPINLAPPTAKPPARHIAVRCDDVFTVARRARERGIDHLRIPANYYDDLAARFDLPAEILASLRELDLLYDRDANGEFIHFYTRTIGDVFFEVVERRGGYDGYGGANAPIRLAAQR
ncbi:sugar phosphate isomerase/epimerase and 4-hydroxyphenylpyruvate domain-containing protein [Microbacterium aerolatum]|uniref:3-dehydroshikimate dehydratase n=1 Tax=Microbacterium aerolatum TaxID=153731 RepID=A0A511AGV4_9MICO|nr:sugar phosphate isomerase/epimerase and 4-hydroxyphenylpyruvate domain-containing protein [Microbacterium aerolatum]GEK87395.1 4-hydroxyphenylpyruvate dioxygenase [Microbacterium aerolatum]GGB33232.1 4-hydroxyphenylpyruvate dioxygenase [Microbacterium aerolatum]